VKEVGIDYAFKAEETNTGPRGPTAAGERTQTYMWYFIEGTNSECLTGKLSESSALVSQFIEERSLERR